MNGFYQFAIAVMRVVMPLWFKIDAEGLENLPEEGGYLFVSNHRSNADPILIGLQNPETQFCFLAKQELFSQGFVGWLLRKLGAVAVDRGAGDLSPLEEIAFRLQNGENALIFPEGTRSKDGKLGHFKTGAALIAAQTGVPVVPAAIVFEDEKLHFRSHITVRYGAPFEIPQTDPQDPSAAVLKQIRRQMTDQVKALLTAPPDLLLEDHETQAAPERQIAPAAERNETNKTEDTENNMSKRNKKQWLQDPAEEPRGKKAAAKKDDDDFGFDFDFDKDILGEEAPEEAPYEEEAAYPEEEVYSEEETADLEEEAAYAEEEADYPEEEVYAEEEAAYPEEEEIYAEEETAYPEEEEIYAEEEAAYPEEEEIYAEEETAYPEEEEIYAEDEAAYPEEEAVYAEDETVYPEEEEVYAEDEAAYPEDEAYAEEEYPEDEAAGEPAEEEYYDDDPDIPPPESVLPFKFKNPFKNLFRKKQAEPEFEEFDDLNAEQPVDEFADYDEAPADEFADYDEAPADEFADYDEAPADEFADYDEVPADEDGFAAETAEEPAFDEGYDDAGYDEEEYLAEESEDPFHAEPEEAEQEPAAFAPRRSFGRKPAAFAKQEEFDSDYDDSADEEEDVDYLDDDADPDRKHPDYGKIALVLTFVILGIFAVDFCRRLWNDWRGAQGMLNIQGGVSSEVESFAEQTSEAESEVTTSAPAVSEEAVAPSTTSTTVFTSPVEPTTTDNGGEDVETRDASTKNVSNTEMQFGSMVMVDADHPYTGTPNLISFADIQYTGSEPYRLVSTALLFDSSISESMKAWFTGFNAATGLSNIMVYSTSAQPDATKVPYGINIPERATGLTLDIAVLGDGTHSPYSPDGNYAWLAEHAHEYGFILRYPEGKTDVTGVEPLSWHFRYVGVPHAAYMHENDLTLEEYLDKISVHTWEKEHLSVTIGGTEYEMYYVPASETSDSTEIQYPVGAEVMISGDNIDGFVVACPK